MYLKKNRTEFTIYIGNESGVNLNRTPETFRRYLIIYDCSIYRWGTNFAKELGLPRCEFPGMSKIFSRRSSPTHANGLNTSTVIYTPFSSTYNSIKDNVSVTDLRKASSSSSYLPGFRLSDNVHGFGINCGSLPG